MTLPFLTRVRIKNYKSIAACDVKLGSLAFLVGPNGSGKSNFLDALRFVADALSESTKRDYDPANNVVRRTPGTTPDTPLGHALQKRGGIDLVHRQRAGDPRFSIRLDFQLPGDTVGHYAVEVGINENAQHRGEEPQFAIHREECSLGPTRFWYDKSTHDGLPPSSLPSDLDLPRVDPTQLYLHRVALSIEKAPKFKPLLGIHGALQRMRFYNLSADAMRQVSKREPDALLRHDGDNLFSVLPTMRKRQPEIVERIDQYVGCAVPGTSFNLSLMDDVNAMHTEFQQEAPGQTDPRELNLPPRSMSDGTLRVAGILTALLQEDASGPPSLVAIEEPEMALHPAAVGILLGAMKDAAQRMQVIAATHSPELLHSDEVAADELLAVSADAGATVIGKVDEGSRKVLGERLFSPGELLRLDQLEPDDAAAQAACDESDLFEFES